LRLGSSGVSRFGAKLTEGLSIQECESPNHGPRKDGLLPDLIILHYTAMQSAAGAIRHLCDPQSEVSAHYVIAEDGKVTRLVPEDQRAWHAGRASWGGESDVNSRSIGIELANDGASPFAAMQMDALETLLPDIMTRWEIPPKGILGHSCVAPGRKIDPGTRFDWARLARSGCAVLAPKTDLAKPPKPSDTQFENWLASVGSTAQVPFQTRLASFRLRWRHWASGPLSAEDMALARTLAESFPVDPARRQA